MSLNETSMAELKYEIVDFQTKSSCPLKKITIKMLFWGSTATFKRKLVPRKTLFVLEYLVINKYSGMLSKQIITKWDSSLVKFDQIYRSMDITMTKRRQMKRFWKMFSKRVTVISIQAIYWNDATTTDSCKWLFYYFWASLTLMRYLDQLYKWAKSIEPYHFSSKFHCDPFFPHFTPSL